MKLNIYKDILDKADGGTSGKCLLAIYMRRAQAFINSKRYYRGLKDLKIVKGMGQDVDKEILKVEEYIKKKEWERIKDNKDNAYYFYIMIELALKII